MMDTKSSQCPYGAESCPKVRDLEAKVNTIEKNQAHMAKILYYIAGIVSVSLGINVII